MRCPFAPVSDQRQDTVRVGMLVVRFSGTLKTTICYTSPCTDTGGNSVHSRADTHKPAATTALFTLNVIWKQPQGVRDGRACAVYRWYSSLKS